MVNAEDAVNYLEQTYVIEPTFADSQAEDALQLIKDALVFAHKALQTTEWTEGDGWEWCPFCGAAPDRLRLRGGRAL